MQDVFIVAAKRTPIGAFCGSLAPLLAVDLGIAAAKAALTLPDGSSLAGDVGLSFFGCARQAGTRPNPARQIAVRSGVPVGSPAATINMACASGLQSLIQGVQAIRLGDVEAALVGGVESMSNVPHLLMGSRNGWRLGHQKVLDAMHQDGFHCALCDMVMGETADRLAAELGITREACDAYAAESQQRCERARAAGAFADEIAAVEVPGAKGAPVRVERDEHPRDGVTAASLAKLKPVFTKDGVTTPGNASGINDAGAAILLASERFVRSRGLTPLARVGGYAQAGVEPARMALGPVPAMRLLAKRTGRAPESYDHVELNEAFAAQVLACQQDLALDPAKLNPLGGAIALGHPVGATGARLVVTLAHALRRSGKARGVATLCVSGGLGLAVEIETCA